jgi:hypothetical protein
MRWSSYTAALAAADLVRLANALTMGWGYLALARQLAVGDRATAVILSHIVHATGALVTAQTLLVLPDEHTPRPDLPTEEDVECAGHTSWQEFLGLRAPHAALALQRALDDGAVHARRAATVATRDGRVEEAAWHVAGALARLAEVHQCCRLNATANGRWTAAVPR